MDAYKLVGIAMPQIGIDLRIFAIHFRANLKENYSPDVYKNREMSPFPLTFFINPEMKVIDHKKVVFEEACASIVSLSAGSLRD